MAPKAVNTIAVPGAHDRHRQDVGCSCEGFEQLTSPGICSACSFETTFMFQQAELRQVLLMQVPHFPLLGERREVTVMFRYILAALAALVLLTASLIPDDADARARGGGGYRGGGGGYRGGAVAVRRGGAVAVRGGRIAGGYRGYGYRGYGAARRGCCRRCRGGSLLPRRLQLRCLRQLDMPVFFAASRRRLLFLRAALLICIEAVNRKRECRLVTHPAIG